MKSSKKKLNGVLGVVILLLYTILVAQIAHALREPEIIKEYIEVEVPVVISRSATREETKERDYKVVTAIVTAYAPYDNKSGMCNDGNPDKTSTGTKPKHGTLAADPKRLPYGTKIEIPNYGTGIVEDTGGLLRADKENIRIDVFVDTYEEAMAWGRQELEVKVYND